MAFFDLYQGRMKDDARACLRWPHLQCRHSWICECGKTMTVCGEPSPEKLHFQNSVILTLKSCENPSAAAVVRNKLNRKRLFRVHFTGFAICKSKTLALVSKTGNFFGHSFQTDAGNDL